MSGLRQKTLEIQSQLNLEDRKKKGQYFTTKPLRRAAFDTLPNKQFERILEPSFGTGEFLLDLETLYPNSVIDGFELDPKLYNSVTWDRGNLINDDFLTNTIPYDTYDLVIGNPPYFQLQNYDEEKYGEVVNGRPNIFSFFFHEGIRLVKDGGWLVYIVPTSMCTGKYFANLRKYINKWCGVRSIVNFNDKEFDSALQSVVIITMVKGGESDPSLVNEDCVFNYRNDDVVKTAFRSGKTLEQLGFKVKTGNLVWNQHKEALTSEEEGNVKLLWSHNIGKNGLTEQTKKPQYVLGSMKGKIRPLQAPFIIVNRVIGSVGNGSLNACLVEEGEFYTENHVNVITHDNYQQLPILLKELKKPRTSELARRITGNTQLSKTELLTLLPIEL